jgi:hypothetical protein
MLIKGLIVTQDKLEEITLKNAVCIGELTQIAKQTSEDTDKMLRHMDKLAPFKEKIEHLSVKVGEHDELLEVLSPVVFITQYPKLAALMLLGVYALSMAEVRSAVAALFTFTGVA